MVLLFILGSNLGGVGPERLSPQCESFFCASVRCVYYLNHSALVESIALLSVSVLGGVVCCRQVISLPSQSVVVGEVG